MQFFGNPYLTLGNVSNYPMKANREYGISFTAPPGAFPSRFDIEWRCTPTDSNYSRGDGGTYAVTIYPDDGTGLAWDLSKPQAYGVIDIEIDKFPSGGDWSVYKYRPVYFTKTTLLEAARKHWVVIKNIHEDADNNFVSYNGPFCKDRNYQIPGFRLLQRNTETGDYRDVHNSVRVVPDWQLTFSSGQAVGQPYQYGEYWTNRPTVSGQNQIRQILVANRERTFKNLSFYATRIHGIEDLVANIFVRHNYVCTIPIDSTYIPELELQQPPDGKLRPNGNGDFNYYELIIRQLPEEIRVEPGEQIRVEFSTGNSTRYYIPGSVFAGDYTGIRRHLLAVEGHAEYSKTSGSVWNWHMNGNPNKTQHPGKKVMLSLILGD